MQGEPHDSGEGQPPTSPRGAAQPQTSGTDAQTQRAPGYMHGHHPRIEFRPLDELKHRNVVRVGILYLVVSWLILDPVHVIFHMLEVPAWANRLVLILIAIGFPAVLLFAWVYEITPEGLKPTVDVEPSRSIRRQTGRRLNRAIVAVMAMALAYFIVDKFWVSKHLTTKQSTTSAASMARAAVPAAKPISDKSIAVLPFVDLSEKKDQEYFSEGLSEELIDLLTKIPELHVPARTSSFSFKNKAANIADIGRELSVAHVLEGSVRKSGNHLRITVQLVRTDSGYHVWSETYDRDLNDIFKVQKEIAAAVVIALKVSLLEGEATSASATSNTEAYTLYLQARSLFQHARNPAEDQRVFEYLHRALKLDPKFARAWAALAFCRVGDASYSDTPLDPSGRAEAREAAELALKLDPKLSDSHLAMGRFLFQVEWDWNAAEAELRRAIALDPNNADALYEMANLLSAVMGHFDEAAELAQRAVARDPLYAWNYQQLAGVYYFSARLADAEVANRKALELSPTDAALRSYLVWTLLARGEPAAALAEMERQTEDRYRQIALPLALDALGRVSDADRELAVLQGKYAGNSAYWIAVTYANRRDLSKAFAWLDRAYQQREQYLSGMRWDPLLRNLRSEPRYRAFLRKMKLPE